MAEAFADVAVDLSKACDVFDELEKYAGTSTTGILATVETAKATLTGLDGRRAIPVLDDLVASVAEAVSVGSIQDTLEPILLELARSTEIGSSAVALSDVRKAILDYMVSASQTIKSPTDAYDTSVTSTGTGTGVMYRLTVDENGRTLYGLDPDTYTITCVRDARQSGRAHDETFGLKGTAARGDNLDLTGSGLGPDGDGFTFQGTTGTTGPKSLLRNASFDDATFSGATISALAGWRTSTDGATAVPDSNIQVEETLTFRTTPGNANSRAIRFTASETLYQDPVAENNAQIDYDSPYLMAIRVHRVASATGNVELRVSSTLGSGGVTATVALSSITADTWSTLIIALGSDCWPKAWNANDVKFQIKVSSLSGAVVVDDATFSPFVRFGARSDTRRGLGAMGQYVAYLGGATPSVEGDTHVFTDTPGTRGVISYWFRRGELGYLPSVADATQITASGGRTLTFAASGKTCTASSGSFVTDGYEVGMKLTVAGTSSNNGTFTLTAVSATVLTVSETVVDEGPLSSTATLDATAPIADS